MHPTDFWHVYSLAEIQIKLHYFIEMQDNDTRERWELARMQTFIGISPNLKEGAQITDIWQLPWDKEKAQEAKKPITQEDIERSMSLLNILPQKKQ